MFSPTSLVSRVNSGECDSVDSYFIDVFNLSQTVSQASSGRFDPTVAPLVDLWGFGRDGREVELPDSNSINEALEKIGIDRCRIDNGIIVKGHCEMEFDFSAIAKGYGVEKIGDMLNSHGCDDYMVEIGGEIQLSGKNPNGELWHIQVDAPVENSKPGESSLTVLELSDCGVATSGNYRNYREKKGQTAWHTIDPTTGFPAAREVVSATVIAPGCALADALATAIMASPADSAAVILAHFKETSAIIVLDSGQLIKL